MGGNNETKICGLRFHESGGNVHIHDDDKNLKFETSTEGFIEDIDSAFESLNEKEGIVRITGMKNDLYVMKQGRNISVFLMDNSSIKRKLQDFIKGI